jgi:hypothetical protein
MRRRSIGLILSGLLFAPCARADFVVAGQPPAVPSGSPAAQGAPGGGSPDVGGQGSTVSTETPHPAPPQFMVAEGFGDQVPLRFAVRQIVPGAVKVTYGPGADPDAVVDWRGGQGWNRVLFRAVRPLGLRLVITYMAVEIRK